MPRNQSPRSNRSARGPGRSRADSKAKEELRDPWQENIHFTQVHEEPDTAIKLHNNQKLVGEHDQFVEYIHHVESKFPLPILCFLSLYFFGFSEPTLTLDVSDFVQTPNN